MGLLRRRDLLQGLGAGAGGLAIGLGRRTAAGGQGHGPRRLVLVYSPHGTAHQHFWPRADRGRGLTDTLILRPLARHRADLVLVKGLRHTRSPGPPGTGIMRVLTSRDGFDHPPGSERAPGTIGGPSIDEALAQALGAETALPVLRLAAGARAYGALGALSFAADGRPIAPLLVGDVEAHLQAAVAAAPHAQAQLRLGATTAPPLGEEADVRDRQAALVAAALGADLTRVVVWRLASAADTYLAGVEVTDALARAGEPAADARRARLGRFFAERVATLVDRLKATRDQHGRGGQSVFASTLVLWASDAGPPVPGADAGLPLVLLGTAGGALATGRLLDMRPGEANAYGNLLVSVAAALGHRGLERFGDERWCSGPLRGLAQENEV